jgi:starch-binding outer membrane protein SusE/F
VESVPTCVGYLEVLVVTCSDTCTSYIVDFLDLVDADPEFTITFETKKADQYWKIIPKKNIDAGDLWADGVVGPKENGSISKEGDLTNVGPGAGRIKEPGKYMLTLNMMDYSYTIKPVPELYMKGDANGWDGYDYLAGDDGVHFTGFMYLNQNGFKFTTAPDWSGTGYGANFDTAPDAANIVITEPAGYYQVDVDLFAKTYTLTPITSIGIIGSAAPNGWDSDVDLTYNIKERCWEVKDIKLKAGEIKFRANDGWDISWGGKLDKLTTKNGGNITVEAGTYDIKLYAWAEGYAKCVMTKK